MKTELRVRNFSYNGFYGQVLPGYASYTATPKEWTVDPGVVRCNCSDGKTRLIPTFAFGEDNKEFDWKAFGEQPKTGVFFGEPSHS